MVKTTKQNRGVNLTDNPKTLKDKDIQIQDRCSFYPIIEIMVDDVTEAEGNFVDKQSRNEATYEIQTKKAEQIKQQILENQEKAEKWNDLLSNGFIIQHPEGDLEAFRKHRTINFEKLHALQQQNDMFVSLIGEALENIDEILRRTPTRSTGNEYITEQMYKKILKDLKETLEKSKT